mgnify:CR=1 FL=1
MGGSILGERVLRKEDPKFLTSGGKYVDDLLDEPLLKGALHVTYARSTVAHGRINSIDVSDAVGMPGIVAVLTAADLDLQPVPSSFNPAATRTLLASDKVRYVGEPVAVVLAAVGQAFYATGVGMAMMIAMGSYVTRGTSLVRSSLIIVGSILLVSMLATLTIFPLVFHYGMNPAAGTELVFDVLATVFAPRPEALTEPIDSAIS